MIDSNMVLRAASAGNLSADELTPTGVNMGVDLVAQTYMVFVPSVSGTSATLDVTIERSDDDNTYRILGTFPQIVQASAPGQYFISLKSNAKYRRYTADVGGTNPNFGAVIIAPVPAGRYTNY